MDKQAPQTELRKGWTTGACATAAARAAFQALLSGQFPDPVTILLPRGQTPSMALKRAELAEDTAIASVIKDAGDDPDVTHGAEIVASVKRLPEGSGIRFRAGPGVGEITLPGLPLPPGEPAINPGPRAQITENLGIVAQQFGAAVDVEVTISVPGGEEIAAKTWNPRLGIIGGISILGTTGVVIPYSCSAWIHSIHRGIDVARAMGVNHVGAATGKTSEAGLRKLHGLSETAILDMGDFAGGVLKYLRQHPVPRLTIGGGFAKISKLAAGEMDLHSSRSQVDIGFLLDLLRRLGATDDILAEAQAAQTAAQILAAARDLPLGEAVARRARESALAVLSGGIEIDVAVFDRAGNLIGHA